MEWLNYHHLLYFWVVAREGGLTAAGKVLRLSHPTLSAQIHTLEDSLGEKLFVRQGRKLELTEMGRLAYRYAEEIFTLGRELQETMKGRPGGKPLRLQVGIADVVPKLVVRNLIRPALEMDAKVRLICTEDRHDRLLAALSLHALDVVLADAPVPPGSGIRAYNHLLGESGVTFFGTPAQAASLKRGFPKSLDGAKVLLPLETLPIRRSLNQWFESVGVRPHVVAEFEDSALLKVFGGDGLGIFPAPTVVEDDIQRQHELRVVGRVEEVRERFYAISMERRIQHPGVQAILAGARDQLR
jgi:LysR family transcriptional activator of nhaA